MSIHCTVHHSPKQQTGGWMGINRQDCWVWCLHRHSALLVADSTSMPGTGKLQSTGQIQLTTYFCAAFELRIFFFFHFWMTGNTQKKTILWHVHIIWNLNLNVQSCTGTQPCSLVYMLSMAAFMLQKSDCHRLSGRKGDVFCYLVFYRKILLTLVWR